MSSNELLMKEVEEKGGAFRGKQELLKHLNGEVLNARKAILAKCYDCMGYYADGRMDCKLTKCSLYPYMNYKEGGARKSRILSEEQKKAAGERFKQARNRSVANKG